MELNVMGKQFSYKGMKNLFLIIEFTEKIDPDNLFSLNQDIGGIMLTGKLNF